MVLIESAYLTVKCRSEKSAEEFLHAFTASSHVLSLFKSLFGGVRKETVRIEIKDKLDILYEKVAKHLDMWKVKRKGKTIIEVYDNEGQLHQQYEYLYGKTKLDYAAWYVFQLNTIFLNMEVLTEAVLAHELSHAIVGTYLGFKLPRRPAEVLARNVDKHLYSKLREYREWG